MGVEHNERNRYLWSLALERTTDFVIGLEAGMASVNTVPDMVGALSKMSASRDTLVNQFGDVAFKELKIHSLELISNHDWKGGAALIEGMQEGVEYAVDKQLNGGVTA